MAGWWLTYPPEKYESQIGSSSQVLVITIWLFNIAMETSTIFNR